MLHVSHQDAILLIIIPRYAGDFLLPTRRENGERNYFLHRHGLWSSRFNLPEMHHEAVKLIEGWSPISTVALGRDTKALGDNEGVFDGLAVERIAPRRSGDGEHRCKMAQIVLDGLWLYRQCLRKCDDLGACDLAALHLGKVIGLNGAEYLCL